MSFQLNTQKKKEANEFASFYGRFVSAIKTLKPFLHAISASSQGYGVFLIITSNMPTIGKALAVFLAVAMGITVGIAIEKGVTVVGRVWWRVIFRKKFGNGYWWGMFAYSTIILGTFLYLSPWLSGTSARYSVAQIITDGQAISTDSLEQAAQLASDSIRQVVALQIEADQKAIDRSKYAIREKYKAQRSEQYDIYEKHKRLLAQGNIWAQSHMDQATAKRKQIDIAEKEELAIQESQRLQMHQSSTTRLDGELAVIAADRQRKIQNIEDKNATNKGKRDQERTTWSLAAWQLAVFGSLGVFLIIGIEELYRAGSDQEPPSYIDEERESWSWRLRQLWNQRTDQTFTRVIEWFGGDIPAGSKEPKHVPHRIGFQIPSTTSIPPSHDHSSVTASVTPDSNTSGTLEGSERLKPLYAQGVTANQPSVTEHQKQGEHLRQLFLINQQGIPVFSHIDEQGQIKYCPLGECKRRKKIYEKRISTTQDRLMISRAQGFEGTAAYQKTATALDNQQDNYDYWHNAVLELEDMIALQKKS